MPLLSCTAAAPGDVGPLSTLVNKECGTTITVELTDVLGNPSPYTLLAVPTSGANEVQIFSWVVYGPEETSVALSGTATTNPRTFTPDYPGRWLIQCDLQEHGGSREIVTGLVDILDPQLVNASIPAPNEKNEFDANLGWSRAAEEAYKNVGRTLGFRELVSVTATGSLTAGKMVTPTASWMVQWKNSTIQFLDYNNFTIEVEEVDDASGRMATNPIFLLLEDLNPAVGSGQEKAMALVKGLIPIDTTAFGGVPAAGTDVYGDGQGANPEFTTVAPGTTDRKLGKIILNAADNVSPPGLLYFDGHFEAFFHQLHIGDKLTVGGLIDPTGLELTAVAANPGGVPTQTIWVDSTAANSLKYGANVIMPLGGVSSKYEFGLDPTQADDSTGSYAVGDVWVNNVSDEAFICADSTAAAAVWRRISAHSAATDPTVTDDASAMYFVGDTWINNLTTIPWTCIDSTPGAAVWRREMWEVVATTGAVAAAEHKVHYVCTDPGGGGYTITAPAGAPQGLEFRVTNNDGTPDTITVDGNGANIVGAASKALVAQYDSYTFSADGTEWFLR